MGNRPSLAERILGEEKVDSLKVGIGCEDHPPIIITSEDREKIAAFARTHPGTHDDVRLAGGRFFTTEERTREKNKLRLTRLKCLDDNVLDVIKFYLDPNLLRIRYDNTMFSLCDKYPRLYNLLMKLGLPKPYLDITPFESTNKY